MRVYDVDFSSPLMLGTALYDSPAILADSVRRGRLAR